MDLTLITIIIILVLGFAASFFFISKKFKELKEARGKNQSLLLLNQNIQGMQQRIDVTQKAISERLDNAAK